MTTTTFPENIHVTNSCSLTVATARFADEIHALINQNREHLSQALDWPRFVNEPSDTVDFLQRCETNFRNRKDAVYVVLINSVVAGIVSLHEIQLTNQTSAVGYWLAATFEGAGIISQSVDAMIREYAAADILHRFVIKASVENKKSQAVAERLQFVREGRLTRGERIGDRFHDQFLYAKII